MACPPSVQQNGSPVMVGTAPSAALPHPTVAAIAAAILPRKNLVLPHEKTRLDFARGLPQRNHIQLMLRAGLARASELKRLTGHRISPRPPLRSGRATYGHGR